MCIYKEIPENLERSLKTYVRKGEKVKCLDIRLKDKIYKEIEFRKKAFGRGKYIIKGILYLSCEGKVVHNEEMILELSKLAFYYKSIFNRESKFSIISTYNDEGTIKRYEYDFNKALLAIEFLKEKSEKNTEKIKNVIEQTIRFRKEKNKKIEELINIEKQLKINNLVFDEYVFNEAYLIYEEILITNFKSIKLIISVKEICDDFIKLIRKYRRVLTLRFNKEIRESLLKLEYQITYFKKIISAYESIANYDINKYINLVRTNNNKIIKENIKGLRR
ncbi:hypothetical protein [Clostridium rectalis]|uniref:hypothetical protein n=1 Tax=Clostridium rectalis TaxID=2040295 RepID=UPI000F63A400|nr:hypothetical protein [Clostridium rectalis]